MRYSFKCKECDYMFDVDVKLKDYKGEQQCPECSSIAVRNYSDEKVGHIYKGTGFYCTDYKERK